MTHHALKLPETACDELGFQPQTDLGRKLWDLRQRIVSTGVPLLNEDQIEEEIDRRRGGVDQWDP